MPRGRPRKARVEGAEAVVSSPVKPLANPVPGDDGEALGRIAAFFRDKYPEDWETIALCPTQHGLEVMANKLRGNG